MTEKKKNDMDIEKILREGKEVIFQEERSKRKFRELFKELQARKKDYIEEEVK